MYLLQIAVWAMCVFLKPQSPLDNLSLDADPSLMNSQLYDKGIKFEKASEVSSGPARQCPCRQTSPSTPQVVFVENDSSESSSTERHCSFCGAQPHFTERRHRMSFV